MINLFPYFDDAEGLDVSLDEEVKSDLDLLTPEEETDNEEQVEEEETTEEDNTDTDEEVKEDEEEPVKEEKEVLTKASYSAVKEKYPELFKDFPELKKAFFREQEFSKVFPTVESAQEAANSQVNFENLRDLVLSGNATEFLNEVASTDKDALDNLANNFLPGLRSVNKDLYITVTTPIIQNILKHVLDTGIRDKNVNIQNAAKLAYHTIFGTMEVAGASDKSAEPSAREKKFIAEKTEFETGKFNSLSQTIANEAHADLSKEIEKGLDPNKVLTPGMKKMLVERITNEIHATLGKDDIHRAKMGNLWKREKNNGFSGALKDSIKTAFLSRAIAIMPGIRQKIRTEVLGVAKKSNDDNKEKLNAGKRLSPSGRVGGGKTNKIDKKDAAKMSDMDIILAGTK